MVSSRTDGIWMSKLSSVVVGHCGSGDGPLKLVGAPLTDWPCDRHLAP